MIQQMRFKLHSIGCSPWYCFSMTAHEDGAEAQDQPTPQFLHLTYVKGVSERIMQIHRGQNNLPSLMDPNKRAQPAKQRKGFVYQVTCTKCVCVCIGGTLEKRLSKYIIAI